MIGIFGGTFDPIHNGHLRIALDAQETLGFSETRFIPLHQAVHRDQPIGSSQQRLKMLELAICEHRKFSIDRRELVRLGPSYMVDTLSSLATEINSEPLCLLLGSDAFNGFMRWKEPEKILKLANILVMQRPSYKLPDEPDLQALVAQHECTMADLTVSKKGSIGFLNVTQLDISSSNIRQRLRSKRSLKYLVPDSVITFINNEKLYAN